MRFSLSLILFILLSYHVAAQAPANPLVTKDVLAQQRWVDSIYDQMDLRKRVGQLFMVRAISNNNKSNEVNVANLINTYHIGGIIYSSGGPVKQATLNNRYQAISNVPLLIGMDAEWGLSMRLDSTYAFPYNMTLGAITDNRLVEQMGRQLGEHCKRIGVHFNFAPDVDINTNPKNPIIGNRSFGEDRDNVTAKGLAFMRGMQDAGVLANAKHFPGHGDTETDSHKTLPTINFNEKRLDSIELYPYKKLINEGLSSVMVAHLNVPSLEPKSGTPSSLSKHIITDILKDRLQFEGLIFTDALEMKGVSNYSKPGDIDLAAFLAGNDVLLISENVPIAISKIVAAYEANQISEERLAYSVKKILKAKYKVGLNEFKPIETEHLVEDLNRIKDDLLYGKLMENAITVVRNQKQILPLRNLETKRIAYVEMGDAIDNSAYLDELRKYTKVHQIKADRLDQMITKLQNYNTVIVGFHKSNVNPWKSYEFSVKELNWLYEIARTNTVILDVFARPYALIDLHSIENIEGIVVSYQNSDISMRKSAQLIFGAIPAKGTLPVSTGEHFKVGDGYRYQDINSLSYGIPESVGMSSKKLQSLDSMAKITIDRKAAPGLQILVARKGKVIYNKAFGKHTYEGNEKVDLNDMYDVASLTKILATLPLLMELEEKGVVSMDTKLSDILPEYEKSNKKNVTLKQMLSHYARLKPWIPFYAATLTNKRPDPNYYRKEPSPQFNVKVANQLFLRSDYPDTIQKIIKDTDLLPSLHYRYSDFPYFILKKYIENHYDKGLDELVQEHFYHSLGANHTTYNPSALFSNSQLVPSEIDDYYRYQTIQGYVHDMGAAMQNGVGGHAGIFSNANDVAKIMQMYLQEGYYGGKRYFKPETIIKFNTCYYCKNGVRRGVGFDKPQLGSKGPTCGCVSLASFGHSGFTGTYAWADPEEEIVYVFLSNRTYPNAGKNTLLKEGIRTEIQRLVYEAIIE